MEIFIHYTSIGTYKWLMTKSPLWNHVLIWSCHASQSKNAFFFYNAYLIYTSKACTTQCSSINLNKFSLYSESNIKKLNKLKGGTFCDVWLGAHKTWYIQLANDSFISNYVEHKLAP